VCDAGVVRAVSRHRAPFDAVVLAVTVLAAAPVGVVVAVCVARAVADPADAPALVIAAAVGALLATTWATSARAYRLEPGRLVVERPAGEIVYPLAGLVEARPYGRLGLAIRLGNGGLFGISGWYWSRELGWFRVHARKVGGAVLLRWPDRAVVVMPEEPEGFVADVARFR